MKKLMNIFVLVAAAAMALASCQKPEIKNPEPQSYEYTFLIGDADASDDADSKAVIGSNCIEWESGDQMGVYTKVAAGTISNNAFGDITPGSPATMKVYSNQALAIGDYIYAYYPYSSANKNQNLSVTLDIPAEQDGKDDMPMVAIPHRVESALGSGKQDAPAGKIKFANLGSVIEFNVYTETEEYASEVVTSVAFEADKALAGAFTFDLTNVNYSEASTLSISSELTEKEVVANVSDLAVGTKDEPAIVRMVVAPGSYTGNVVVTTDKATYTFPISTAKEFKRSAIKPLGLKLREDVREENAEPSSKTVTFDFTSTSELVNLGITLPSASAGTDISSMTLVKDEVSMTSTDGTSGTRIWNSSGEYVLRVYKSGGSVTFSVPNGNYISKIIFTGSSLAKLTSSSDTFSSGEWNGNSQTVTFSASERVDIKTVSITYSIGAGSGETPVEKNLESIVVVDPKVAYTVGEEFVEPKVKATYSDGTSAEVTGATFSGYDMSTAGTQTVTVSYTEGDVTEETSYEITVSEAVILVPDGTYVIAVEEESVYYAVSTDANGTSSRREAVDLTGYSGEENYVSHDSKIVWTITNVPGGITVSSGESYWGAVKNGISLNVEDASKITVAKSEIEGAFVLSGDCGDDGIRYLAKNGTYGFGFYAEKDDIYLIPATFVELPTLGTPVVTAELNDTNDGINVSWESVTNAEKYLVACGENSVEVTATEHEFTGLTPGEYSVTVTAVAENYNSATSEPVTVTVPSAGGAPVWTLVTDASTLAAGDQIVIVASDTDYAMGADKGNNRNAVSITKSENTLVINDQVQIITLETGNISNTFAFNTGNGYLYAASSSSNHLKTKSTLDSNGSWKITITSTGVATIISQGDYTRNWIRKNSSSALFACYSSGQEDVSIYKLMKSGEGGGETPEPELQERNLAFSSTTATATVGDDFTEPTLSGATAGVTYSSSNISVATVDETTGEVTLVAAGETTITATADADATYKAGEASYTLTVSAAQGGDDAELKTSSLVLASTKKFGTTSGSTLNADDSQVWKITTISGGAIQNTFNTSYQGQQIGTGNSPWVGTFTSDFSGKNIKSVKILANTGEKASLSVTVGNVDFGTKAVTKNTSNALEYLFEGSASGNVTIKVSDTKKAFYLGAIVVTYN